MRAIMVPVLAQPFAGVRAAAVGSLPDCMHSRLFLHCLQLERKSL